MKGVNRFVGLTRGRWKLLCEVSVVAGARPDVLIGCSNCRRPLMIPEPARFRAASAEGCPSLGTPGRAGVIALGLSKF